MMRACLLALPLLAGLGGAATAQTAECARAWAAISGPLAGGTRLSGGAEAAPDGCLVRDVRLGLPQGAGAEVAIERIRFDRASAQFLTAPAGGGSLDMVLEGVRLIPLGTGGDAGAIRALQAGATAPGAGILSLTWDAAGQRLAPLNIGLSLPGVVEIDLMAEVTGIDLSTPEAAESSAGRFALTRLDLSHQSSGVLETLLLPRVAGDAFPDMTPAAAQGAWLAEARYWLSGLPEASVPLASRAALLAWADALPQAAGRLELKADLGVGLGPARVALMAIRGAPQGPADLAPLMSGMTVTASWTPGARP